MIAELRERVSQVPFRPFLIRMVDGREYAVPTLDHVWFPPRGGRVAVEGDQGGVALLPALFISGIVEPDSPDLAEPAS
ncbi:MAG: hypothetical protein JSR82_10035 [Verrucomicrobia bacterium]|nr:hypothetical protein [Verrucomicrobiota bacterium]